VNPEKFIDQIFLTRRHPSRIKMSEILQQIVLDTLESQSLIKDTRTLVLPGQSQAASSNEDQIAILGALNSLLSRDVSLSL
jgi:hypothetical protein